MRGKKQSTLRLIIQCISFAFHNGYAKGWTKGRIYTGNNKSFCVPGLNCYSCPGAIGSCPIGSLQAVLDASGFHISLYVIGFIGAVGVFCGRFICGWLCPFGLVQDLIYRIPFVKKMKNLPGHKYLRYLRFVILAVFVIALPMGVRNQAGIGQPWFCEYICPSGTLLGGIPLIIANSELAELIGLRFIWKITLLVLIILAAVISNRPFCKYVCPLGALYGLANPVSIYRYRVDKDVCIGCGACRKACDGDIRVWETPNSIDCIRCGKCIAACPTGALYTTFGGRNKDCSVKTEEISAGTVPEAGAMETAGIKEESDSNKIKKRILMLVSGLLCLAACIHGLYGTVIMTFLLTFSKSIADVMGYLQYMMGFFIMLVPTVMTLLLGIGMIAGAVGKINLYQKVHLWPLHILKTIVIATIAVYIGYVVLSILITGTFTARVFSYAWKISMSVFIVAGGLFVAVLVAWIINRRMKSTEEQGQ